MTAEEEIIICITASSRSTCGGTTVPALVGAEVGNVAALVDNASTISRTRVTALGVASVTEEAAIATNSIAAGRLAAIATDV